MSNEQDQPFAVGDRVELVGDRERTYGRVGNSYGSLTVRPGVVLTITRLYSNEMILRGPILRTGGGHMVDASIQAYRSEFQLVDPDRPAPRRLGTKPDGEEFIGIDHPGIQWLFDDMGAFAEREGYCSQYDALCVKLGIPGRPRDFTVKSTINGIAISATVKARSQREANEMFKKVLAEPVSQELDSPFTETA
jgi:hypothetical protein